MTRSAERRGAPSHAPRTGRARKALAAQLLKEIARQSPARVTAMVKIESSQSRATPGRTRTSESVSYLCLI